MHMLYSLCGRRAGLALAALLIGVMAGGPAWSQAVGPGNWTAKAPMPAIRGEVEAVVFENKLYAIGGNVASNAVARNEVYDPATDRWVTRAPMPAARDHLGLGLVNGKIYTFGGFVKTIHEGATTDVFEYTPATDYLALARTAQVAARLGRHGRGQRQDPCVRRPRARQGHHHHPFGL